jgi:hypothetical protein
MNYMSESEDSEYSARIGFSRLTGGIVAVSSGVSALPLKPATERSQREAEQEDDAGADQQDGHVEGSSH